jgi:tetratricopeptide (TPR) repeat protein
LGRIIVDAVLRLLGKKRDPAAGLDPSSARAQAIILSLAARPGYDTLSPNLRSRLAVPLEGMVGEARVLGGILDADGRRGRLLMSLSRPDEALEACRRAVVGEVGDRIHARLSLADLYTALGRPSDAIDQVDRTLASTKDRDWASLWALCIRNDACHQLGDQAAIVACRSGLLLKAETDPPLACDGLLRAGDMEAAVELAVKSLDSRQASSGMLVALQRYLPEHGGLDRLVMQADRWQKLREHDHVQAAVARRGRILDWPVAANWL